MPRGATAGHSGHSGVSANALPVWPDEGIENARRRNPAENATEYLVMADHPYSGGDGFSCLALSLSESFFLPPKIPKIFCKGFFFFSPGLPEASGGAGPWPVASGGRFGS